MGRTQQETCDRFYDSYRPIWSHYLSLVKERDQVRVEQWKGDTEGVLIFTGLFSATVATFLANSLSMLSPDTGDQTVELLSQVLAVLSNSSNIPTSSNSPEVDTSAILVNIFWLASLFASLSSALGAILVQQWVRTYLHDMRQRDTELNEMVRSALALGINRFRLDDVVSALMMLLHISVLLFGAGMLTLLFSTNLIVAYALTGCLALGLVIYTGLTIMPLLWHDTPYHTSIGQLIGLLVKGIIRATRGLVLSILRPVVDAGRATPAWLAWLEKLYCAFYFLSAPLSKRASLTSPTSDPRNIPRDTRIEWYIGAFRESKGLGAPRLDLWEALASSSVDDVPLSHAQALIKVIVSPGWTLADSIRDMLHYLTLAPDEDRSFGRTTLAVCALARRLVPYSSRDLYVDRLLNTSYAPQSYDRAPTYLAEIEASILFEAELRQLILTRALENPAWLSHPDCIQLFGRFGAVDGLNLDRPDTLSNEEIRICIVENFVQMYESILQWVDRLGVQQILATLEQCSWILVVQSVHKAALDAAPAPTRRPSFVVVGPDGSSYLREGSKLACLVNKLGVVRLDDLALKTPASESTSMLCSDIVHPPLKALLDAQPKFAIMLSTLCEALLDAHLDLNVTSPETSSPTRFSRYPHCAAHAHHEETAPVFPTADIPIITAIDVSLSSPRGSSPRGHTTRTREAVPAQDVRAIESCSRATAGDFLEGYHPTTPRTDNGRVESQDDQMRRYHNPEIGIAPGN